MSNPKGNASNPLYVSIASGSGFCNTPQSFKLTCFIQTQWSSRAKLIYMKEKE